MIGKVYIQYNHGDKRVTYSCFNPNMLLEQGLTEEKRNSESAYAAHVKAKQREYEAIGVFIDASKYEKEPADGHVYEHIYNEETQSVTYRRADVQMPKEKELESHIATLKENLNKINVDNLGWREEAKEFKTAVEATKNEVVDEVAKIDPKIEGAVKPLQEEDLKLMVSQAEAFERYEESNNKLAIALTETIEMMAVLNDNVMKLLAMAGEEAPSENGGATPSPGTPENSGGSTVSPSTPENASPSNPENSGSISGPTEGEADTEETESHPPNTDNGQPPLTPSEPSTGTQETPVANAEESTSSDPTPLP